jgi:hypothetical protein
MQYLDSMIDSFPGLGKHRRNFLVTIFSTIFSMRGRVNFANMSRYAGICERTIGRQFRKAFDWVKFNLHVLNHCKLDESDEWAASMDASFIPKAGKLTHGLGKFWCGTRQQVLKGLEISVIAITSLALNTAFTLSVVQTEGLKDGETSIDFFLRQVQEVADEILKWTKYLVADGAYSKVKFVDGVVAAGLVYIGRLREDANMQYLYQGPRCHRRGRPKKYDGKYDGWDLGKWEFVRMIEDGKVALHSAVLYHTSLGRNIRVVALLYDPRKKPILLFSTETEIDPMKLYKLYASRFQIEFVFRDAKQHLGLNHCQSRNKEALNFHFNCVLAALNIAKADILSQGFLAKEIPFSLQDYKIEQANHFLLERIIRILDIDPDLIKNHPEYERLINFGRIAA